VKKNNTIICRKRKWHRQGGYSKDGVQYLRTQLAMAAPEACRRAGMLWDGQAPIKSVD